MLDVGASGDGGGRGGLPVYLAAYGMVSLSGTPIGPDVEFQPVSPFRAWWLWVWPLAGAVPMLERCVFKHTLQLVAPVPTPLFFAPDRSIAAFLEMLRKPPAEGADRVALIGDALVDVPDRPVHAGTMCEPFSVLNVGAQARLRFSVPVAGYVFWGEALVQ